MTELHPEWSYIFVQFPVDNKGTGPYGVEAGLDKIQIGDVIQLGHANGFYHLFCNRCSQMIYRFNSYPRCVHEGLSTYF